MTVDLPKDPPRRAAVAGEGPAPHPAAVVAVINANHLVRVRIAHEGDAIALMEGAN